MVLNGISIAGITVASTVVAIVIILGIYILIRYRRRNAEYIERCGRLWRKYGRRNQGSEMVAKFPFADPTYVKTPVPGQQFTPQELNSGGPSGFVALRKQSKEEDEIDSERRPFVSMSSPIEPETLNPRHYSYGTDQQQHVNEMVGEAETHPSQVYFSVEYQEKSKDLQIFVEQAKHLRPNNYAKICDPYCVVSLLPGDRDPQRSQVQRDTVDPVFHESFSFTISQSELQESTLQMKFFAYDQYSHDDCIGVVEQKLEDLTHNIRVEFWRRINPTLNKKVLRNVGELLLRLGYQAVVEKLTVVLLKVRSLQEVGPDDSKTPPDPYIRVAIAHDGNLLKKKKTSTKKRSCSPTFNQVVNFSVPLHLLPQIEIQFDVVHEDVGKLGRAARKEVIGSLEIGPHSVGNEKEHWKDLMSNKPQARWHHLVLKPPEELSDSGGQQSLKYVATEPLLDIS